jgi:adenylate kinase
MLNIVLFGPPGAGKGTQAKKLIDSYHLIHLSTGDLLRAEIAKGTSLGIQAKSIMDRGDLVSDEIVIGMIENKLTENPDSKGFIFDGFPRTTAQAQALDELLERKNSSINMMIALEVDNVELTRRLLVRGHESGRADDQNEDIIKNRIAEYNNKTAPLKNYYSNKGKFHSVYGIGTVEQIFELLCATIDNKTKVKVIEPDGIPTIADVNLDEKKEFSKKATEVVAPKVAEVKKAAPAPKVVEVKKAAPAPKKVEVKKAAPAKPAAKKVVKPAAKKVTKKADPKKAAKPAKKVVAKKAVKKAAPKKAVKPVKKAAAKKVVKKAAKPAKKVVAKKVVKKAVKKVAPKKASKPAKKVVAKKAVKKVVKKAAKPAKKVVASRASATKAKKAVKKVPLPTGKAGKKAVAKKKKK